MLRSTSFPFQEFLVPHLHQTSSQTQTLLVFSPATNSWRQGSALLQLYWRVMRPDGGGWGCALSVCFSELSLSSLERVFPSPLETVTAVWNNLPPQDLKRDKTGSICHVTHCRFWDWLQEALHGTSLGSETQPFIQVRIFCWIAQQLDQNCLFSHKKE